MLVLSVLLLAIQKHTSSFLAPVGIGLTLFAVHLFALQYTGSAVNTARAFAPCVVTGTFEGTHWVYWVGPTLGALFTDAICTLLCFVFLSFSSSILMKSRRTDLLIVHSDKRLFKTKGGHEAAAVAIVEQAKDLAQGRLSNTEETDTDGSATAGNVSSLGVENDLEKGGRRV